MDAVDFPPVISPMTETMLIDNLKQQVSELEELFLHLCARALGRVARELVKKWELSVKKQAVESGEGKHLEKGSTVWRREAEALENRVKDSERAIIYFPVLRQSHPHECATIDNYWRMKQLLSESFKGA